MTSLESAAALEFTDFAYTDLGKPSRDIKAIIARGLGLPEVRSDQLVEDLPQDSLIHVLKHATGVQFSPEGLVGYETVADLELFFSKGVLPVIKYMGDLAYQWRLSSREARLRQSTPKGGK